MALVSAIRGDSTGKRLQMTAPISPGSSGSPVLNGGGEVIGVSFATFRDGQNLNFAIPSNYLKGLLAQLGTAKPLSEGKQPISAETYLLRGWVKSGLDDYKGAIADYDKAIQLKPNFAEAYAARGAAKYSLGRTGEAKQDLQTALKLAEQADDKRFKAKIESAIRDLD